MTHNHGHFFCRSCDAPYCDDGTMPKLCVVCAGCSWLYAPPEVIRIVAPDEMSVGLAFLPVIQIKRLIGIINRLEARMLQEQYLRYKLERETRGATKH